MQELIDNAFKPIAASISLGKIPGAQLGIINKNGVRAVAFGGHAQISPISRSLNRETIFDLASVTKVMFTTIAILDEVAKGNIALDDTLSKHIPDLRQYDIAASERNITIEQCLTHQTFFSCR